MEDPFNIAKGAYAMVRIVQDPTRLDEVFVLSDALEGSEKLAEMVAELRASGDLAEDAFEKRPRLNQRDPAPWPPSRRAPSAAPTSTSWRRTTWTGRP